MTNIYLTATIRTRWKAGCSVIVMTLVLSGAASADFYTVTDLGTLGGRDSAALDINSSNQVCGNAEGPDGENRAFLYENGVMRNLGVLPGGRYSGGEAINDAGDVVGLSQVPGVGNHAVLFHAGAIVDLGTPGNLAIASDINDLGQIVADGSGYPQRAFLIDGATRTDLGTLGGSTHASGINVNGDVVGLSNERAFLYSTGVMSDLGALPGATHSWAEAISDAGQVVGSSYGYPAGGSHAFSYQGGVMTDLGTLGGPGSNAFDVNERGRIVGQSTTAADSNGDGHGFLVDETGMHDLNDLVAPSPWEINDAQAINEAGYIVGQMRSGGAYHACLLTPPNVCGDGIVRAEIEQCDDHNTDDLDGCDHLCHIESETFGGTPLPPGGTATTDPAAMGATSAHPIQASVTTPTGGTVLIERSGDTTAVDGLRILTGLLKISAPPASISDPLVVTLRVEATLVPPTENALTLQITKDGVLVPPCLSTVPIDPAACVVSRTALPGGDVEITVLTATASVWGIAADICPATPTTNCTEPPLPKLSTLALTRGKTPDGDSLTWTWSKGPATIRDFGTPPSGTDFAFCMYQGTSRILAHQIRGGGMCGGKPCWLQNKTGYQYASSDDAVPLKSVRLKASRGGAGITVKSKGAALALPMLPLADPVTVQLRSSTGSCWGAIFSAASKNDVARYRARSS